MAAEQLDARKEAIRRAIVRDFILDGQPVGSKRVAEELDLAVSAATVRGDMAELEQAGFRAVAFGPITQTWRPAAKLQRDMRVSARVPAAFGASRPV